MIRFPALFCMLLTVCSASAQESHERFLEDEKPVEGVRLVEYGFAAGYSFIGEKMPEGNYQPILLMGSLVWNLFGDDIEAGVDNTGLQFYAEPQLNPAFVQQRVSAIEFGVNFGLRLERALNASSSVYAAVGVGPHFINVETTMQARGFIFSDNFAVGLLHELLPGSRLNVQYRFRHISNASLRKPNLGIDNHFLSIGLAIRR